MSRKSFPKSAEKKTRRFECVVSDVCGPMQTESAGRSKYLITFTDLFSGYTEVGFMRSKDETPDKVIEFVEKVKTQFEEKPKVFRSDRGGEYTNHRLQNYLKKEGISFQCTVAYTPEQNGVAERKNRTLIEAARTMTISSRLPKRLWAEAIHNANYTFNRIPSDESGKTPFELMFNKIPTLDFYEFGSDVLVMIPYQKRRKLDDKAEEMKFLGHDEQSKGFRVLDSNGAVKISRDVKFIDSRKSEVVEIPIHDTSIEEEDENLLNFDNENEVSPENNEPDISDNDDESTIRGSDNEYESVDEVISLSDESIKEPTPEIDRTPQTRAQTPGIARPPQTRSRTKSLNSNILNLVKSSDIREPRSFNEAMNSKQREHWKIAMNEELESIKNNGTWTLTDLPSNRKSIGSKWVFKVKLGENGNVVRYKARLVAQGFTQKFGVDYDEVFAPVARSTSLRILLSIAGKRNYIAKHFDVKTAFLNGNLDEEIYMRQPPGYKTNGKVYKLHKSLYGLKQAARVWNLTLHNELLLMKFKQNEVDKCLYALSEHGKVCYLLIHVDDMVFVGNDENFLMLLAAQLGKKFEMKCLGNVRHYLGIDINKDDDGNYTMSQRNYIEKIIEAAGLSDAKPSKVPLDPG